MIEYVRILKNILANGVSKQPTRFDNLGNVIPVENGTIGTFCETFTHDMSTFFPLLTIRQLPWKSIRVELEGFIKGITDKKWFQERGCKYWDEWANPIKVEEEYQHQLHSCIDLQETPETKKEVQARIDDLGPIYGYQWRNFGQIFHLDNWGIQEWYSTTEDLLAYPDHDKMDGIVNDYDQLKYIVDTLKTNPYDRRMVCSAWNPNQVHLMALPPCHMIWGVVVYGNKLNLWWTQRSVDTYLGLPSNIASYGLLLLLLAKESGLEPSTLHGTLCDCHLYSNQIEAAKELVNRTIYPLPTVKIPDDWGGFWEWDHTKVITENYQAGPKLSMRVIV